jgi:hypothetical protein
MLPQDQGGPSRHRTHSEGGPHLPLPGIRDIFGLEATGATQPEHQEEFTNPFPDVSDDLGTLVSQPHYSTSSKSSPLRLNPPSASYSTSRSHLLIAEVSPPESPASSRVSR